MPVQQMAHGPERIGVYTTMDYNEIMEYFVKKWNVKKVVGLFVQGQRDYHRIIFADCLNGLESWKRGLEM
ncbi:Fatty acid desaturase, type [Parasponia andersonii]|uniref:Fatty acid desaturase, type n=1 Tax=Parasponia andersonii TaxID=3476 RepID=A0A2P5DWJ4_PARAD|nr:Fatty acid desaturase, type [Parasponia andersonii]